MRFKIFALSVSVFLLALIGAVLLSISEQGTAQNISVTAAIEPLSTPPIDNDAHAASVEARMAAHRERFTRFYNTTLADYQIVYVVAEGAVQEDSLLSSRSFAELGEIDTAHTWDDVLTLDANTPIQALVIHESARSFIDVEWVQAAYRRGVVMVGINLYYGEMSGIIGNNCVYPNAENPYRNNNYVLYYYAVSPAYDHDRPTINAAILERCTSSDSHTGVYYLSQGYGQNPLTTEGELTNFGEMVRDYLIQIQAALIRTSEVQAEFRD